MRPLRTVAASWQTLGLRARLLMIGVLGVATALGIGGVALYTVLTVVSYRTLDSSGVATATEVAGLAQNGQLPEPIPVTGSQIVQVVDSRDRVVNASNNADRLTAILLPGEVRTALSKSHVDVPGSRAGLASPLRAVVVRTGSGPQRRTVVVAQQVADIQHSQHILKVTLLITYPMLLAVLAFIAWRVMGATLRPVEALRSSAERISGAGRSLRLPVPPQHDEIHDLAVTLNRMLDRLAAARARQRSFVADAAHELRSPLASLQAQLEVAQRLGESPATDDLRAEVLRMSGLVEDLLVLARLDAEVAPTAGREDIDVPALLAEVGQHYTDARVPVSVRWTEQLVVHGHRDELHRALANLVDNAVRHASGVVELSARSEGPAVVVSVDDDGTGIPEPERERVFERFTRLDEARARDQGGSGLGLAIVQELVRRSDGDIRLRDAAGGGLSAQLVLPRAHVEQGA